MPSRLDLPAGRPVAPPPPAARRPGPVALLPGLALVLAVAGFATALGRALPVVGAPVFAIAAGGALAVLTRPGERLRPGLAFAGSGVLQASVVLLGTGLSLREVVHVGAQSLPVMLGTLAVALGGAWLFGRRLGVHRDAATLIGVGTGICGASAIAAVTAVIDAAEADVAYAIGTIFTFNVAAVLLYPTLGRLLGLSQHAFGLWSGTAINDMSSVVAAAYTYGAGAGSYGVVVKLTRTLMIVPITTVLAHRQARRAGPDLGAAPARRRPLLPLFIVGFLAASGLDTAGAVPAGWHRPLTSTGVFMITMALAGIGLSIRPDTLRRAGPRPLLLGGLLWAAVGGASLALQAATGTL